MEEIEDIEDRRSSLRLERTKVEMVEGVSKVGFEEDVPKSLGFPSKNRLWPRYPTGGIPP